MPEPAQRFRIAVVDDSPENLNLISTILAEDFDVRCSKDSVRGLEFIEKTDPDIILLDAVMPGKDGYSLLQDIRKNPSTQDIPVIFLTALTEDRDEERALQLGAVDFIRKPFNPVIVKARLKIQVDLLSERRTVEQLLANTLPQKVIREMRDNGEYPPEVIKSASLLFTDFIKFTDSVSKMKAQDVIAELTDMFSVFDEITEKYGGTRIKTIGDAYFAATGVESEMDGHADAIVNIALEILDYVAQRGEPCGHNWQIRIGICSGQVTAGIVGSSKYLYDVFGDPVNIASRVEGTCDPMTVSACKNTVDLLTPGKFKVVSRGPHLIKGKGELELFYVERSQ